MNPQQEQQLEASVRRELDALGELTAPPALANRILQAVGQRAVVPWYRRAWPTWPLSLRLASLVGLLGASAGLGFGAWELANTLAGQDSVSRWLTDASALWRVLGVLGDIVRTSFSRLDSKILGAGFALMFATGVACVGLGSACVRLALRPALNRIES